MRVQLGRTVFLHFISTAEVTLKHYSIPSVSLHPPLSLPPLALTPELVPQCSPGSSQHDIWKGRFDP